MNDRLVQIIENMGFERKDPTGNVWVGCLPKSKKKCLFHIYSESFLIECRGKWANFMFNNSISDKTLLLTVKDSFNDVLEDIRKQEDAICQ